jgi:16S rRNA (guanine527-N7)-methyltransferase
MSAFTELLTRRCDVSPAQARTFEAHYKLLLHWNQRLNLTRITSLEDAVERHYAESLFLAAHLPAGVQTIVDVGSGAGFPGFPVAVAHPELRVSLLESDQRKAAFLRESSDLAANIEVLAVRAESFQREFDMVISRAVQPKEVIRFAKRNSHRIALLLSAEDAGKLKLPEARVFELPHHPGGVLLLADVPRGT